MSFHPRVKPAQFVAGLVCFALAVAAVEPAAHAAEWVRAGLNTNRPVWGLRGGLLWGLPAGRTPADGPRGLIRLWSPVLTNGGYDLINFIAIEPVVQGRRGFSELERSALDDAPGKRLWAGTCSQTSPRGTKNWSTGELTRLAAGAEQLTVEVGVEQFDNGAHVRLVVTQRSDAPDEIDLAQFSIAGSAPIEYCILTATMGNKARARQLWLKDAMLTSHALYPEYRGNDFAPHRVFALDRLLRTTDGDVLVAITTDEANPAAADPFPAPRHWRYAGRPVTQYWKKLAGTWRDDLQGAVNGRFTYWQSRHPIPRGVAFENFELRERFHDGQRFVFGITGRSPAALGFRSP